MKNKQEVVELVNLICNRFEVPLPVVNYTWKGKSGNANYSRLGPLVETWLNLSISTWTGIEQLVVHETSHLVHFKRIDYKRSIERPHGQEFTKILIEVADFVKESTGFEHNFGLEYPEIVKASGRGALVNYGQERKRIAALNAAKLAGLSESQALEIIKLMEGVK